MVSVVTATHGIEAQCGGPVHDQAAVIMPILDPPAAQARRLVGLGPPQPIGTGGGAAGTPWQLGSIMPAAAVHLLQELKLRDSAYADCVERLKPDLDSRTRALRLRATVLVATASGHPSAREAVPQWDVFHAVSPRKMFYQ